MCEQPPDPLRFLTHGEVVFLAGRFGFRFRVWSVPSPHDPSGTDEGLTIEEPAYRGRHRHHRELLARTIMERMFRSGLREFIILRELASRPVSVARYAPPS